MWSSPLLGDPSTNDANPHNTVSRRRTRRPCTTASFPVSRFAGPDALRARHLPEPPLQGHVLPKPTAWLNPDLELLVALNDLPKAPTLVPSHTEYPLDQAPGAGRARLGVGHAEAHEGRREGGVPRGKHVVGLGRRIWGRRLLGVPLVLRVEERVPVVDRSHLCSPLASEDSVEV